MSTTEEEKMAEEARLSELNRSRSELEAGAGEGEVGEGEEEEEETPAPPPPPLPASKAKATELINFDKWNARLHLAYAQKDFTACKMMVADLMDELKGECEFAFQIRGLVARDEGELHEALDWMGRAHTLAGGNNPKYQLHIGRIHFLLGNHKTAVDYLEKSIKGDQNNYRTYYWLARAVYHLHTDRFNAVEKARDILSRAPMISSSVELLIFLAKLCIELGDNDLAIGSYTRALKLEPENVDNLLKLGLLYLRTGSEDLAFACFGQALSYQPSHPDAILATGYVMQAHGGDHDVALNKYRVAAVDCDYNGSLWSNIGICLYAKGKYIAAVSCLKKAAFLSPLDPKINYNLGLVHHALHQNASAYHFISAALQLDPHNPVIVGTLALVLTAMNDEINARRAHQRAIALKAGPQFILNHAVFEWKYKKYNESAEALRKFRAAEGKPSLALQSLADRLENALLEAGESTKQEEGGAMEGGATEGGATGGMSEG